VPEVSNERQLLLNFFQNPPVRSPQQICQNKPLSYTSLIGIDWAFALSIVDYLLSRTRSMGLADLPRGGGGFGVNFVSTSPST
jgi:hypothetical protein